MGAMHAIQARLRCVSSLWLGPGPCLPHCSHACWLRPLSHAPHAGHHATRSLAQSGCYFNNAAVATRAAQAAGAKRVLILDLDAHHGQGTQVRGQQRGRARR